MISQLARRRAPFRVAMIPLAFTKRNRELAHKDAIITEKIAIIARLEAAAVEKGKATAAAAVEKDKSTAAIIAGYERALDLKDEIVEAKVQFLNARVAASAMSEAHAMHKANVANGVINIRAILETAIETLWIMGVCDDHNDAQKMNVSAMLQDVLTTKNCPGLLHYLAVAAEDNKVMYSTLLDQAKELYSAASTRLHSEEAAGTGESVAYVPAEVFAGHGRVTLIAMAAVISFTGRALTLYDVDPKQNFAKRGANVIIRLPPPTGCKATLDEVRVQPFIEHKFRSHYEHADADELN